MKAPEMGATVRTDVIASPIKALAGATTWHYSPCCRIGHSVNRPWAFCGPREMPSGKPERRRLPSLRRRLATSWSRRLTMGPSGSSFRRGRCA